MAEIYKAIGVVWGISSTQLGYAGTANWATTPTGQTLRKSASKVKVPNKTGGTQGLVFYDPIKELDLEVFPSAATLANAKLANVLPAIGDKFTITDADGDTEIVGDWVVEECSKMRKNDSYVTFTVKLVKYEADLTTSVAA